MMKPVHKIAIIGGESTGKTQLSKQLAIYYKTTWVPEFARSFLEQLHRNYLLEDLLTIAKGQLEWEQQRLQEAHRYLFCDTSLHVIKVWSEHRFGICDPFILNQIQRNDYDLFLLCAPDIPWEHDPLREHPFIQQRNHFFEVYKTLLEQHHKNFHVIQGQGVQRLTSAIQFIDSFFLFPG